MNQSTALLTFSIGPVHAFIAQARRVADLWAGSDLLSHLIKGAIEVVQERDGCAMVFPFVDQQQEVPRGLPNKFVCRAPRSSVEELAKAMESKVREVWADLVEKSVKLLSRPPYDFKISTDIWDSRPGGHRQTDALLDIAWSWVPEDGDYAAAAKKGAQQLAAARRFRPFTQIDERGEKCAVCGERTALPDGNRHNVRSAWQSAEEVVPEADQGFFRFDQTRLCLVCATKRLYPRFSDRKVRFRAFEHFEPKKGDDDKPNPDDRDPYFALVSMDGDHLGEILDWQSDEVVGGDVESFHREVSRQLTGFANSLRQSGSQALNLRALGIDECIGAPPQLIYAGGEDVFFVADPRDALNLARQIRKKYRERFLRVKPLLKDPERYREFTISAGILFAHTKYPAGLLFRDVEKLLKQEAKSTAGRDAVALRLVKRGGVPVQVAFKWDATEEDDASWVDRLEDLRQLIRKEDLASRQTFNLRKEDKVLTHAFKDNPEKWPTWLADRLSRGDVPSGIADELAAKLAPFFQHKKTAALRIARFLGREVPA